MNLEHYTENDIAFVQLPKRILMADAKATKKALHSLLQNQSPRLALDMRQLEYIDSSGLAVLVNCLQSSRKKSGEESPAQSSAEPASTVGPGYETA